MKLLSPTISRLARMRFWRIKNWSNNPVASQREVLQELVTAAQYTEFGKKYQFSRLFTVKDFKKNIPIQEYDDIKPYIQRMMNGEENILWNTPVNWFAKSSGTTSDKSKYIPISQESLTGDSEETSIRRTGYSLPSVHFIFSLPLVSAVVRVRNLKSQDESKKMTSLYAGWVSAFMVLPFFP